MKIELRDVNRENFWEVILLKSAGYNGHHVFEEHVTSNAFSIAQSKVEPEWEPRAIYVDGQLIGFAMYGYSKLLDVYFITRLMIDFKHQRKGYGKAAMLKLLEEMKKYKTSSIYTSFVPDNISAKHLYEGLGFVHTGKNVEFGGENEPLYEYRYKRFI